MGFHYKILSWALIFLLRLRFPPGKSIATILTERYNKGTLTASRNFQRVELKLEKAKLDLYFLLSCKKRNVIRKFLWLNVANKRIRKFLAYYQCQKKLLDTEISLKKFRIRTLTAHTSSAYSDLSPCVRTMDLIHLKSVSDKENSRRIEKHQKI